MKKLRFNLLGLSMMVYFIGYSPIAIAQSGYTENTKIDTTDSDTIDFNIGHTFFTIVKEKDKYKDRPEFNSWTGFDLGVLGYFENGNNFNLSNEYDFLELDYTKSRYFSWNAIAKSIHVFQNHVNLIVGAGIQANNYRFSNKSQILQSDSNEIYAVENEEWNIKKNKLLATYLISPLLLEFNTKNKIENNFHLAVGVVGGYRIGTHLKLKYQIDNSEGKIKIRDQFHLTDFKLEPTVRIGYGSFTLFANYQLFNLLKENSGPKLNSFSVGLQIIGY